MKNHPILLTCMLLLSACSAGSIISTTVPQNTDRTTAPPVLTTDLPETPTPTVSPATLTPTGLPETPVPTASPTTAASRGSLGAMKIVGFGAGPWLSPYGLKLSGDEERLIVSTLAGIFTFSARDLSPLISIYQPASPFLPVYYRRIRVSQDGNQAAMITSKDSLAAIMFWDLQTGSLINEFLLEEESAVDSLTIAGMTFTPDNQQVVMVSEQGLILVLNVVDGQIVQTIDRYVNNTQKPLWIEFDPTGKYVYYTFQDVSKTGVQTVGLNSISWEEASSALADTSDFPWDTPAFSPVLSKPTGFKWGYFTFPGSQWIEAWDYSTFGKRFAIEREDPISAIAFSPNGEWMVMGGYQPPQLEVWAIETIKEPVQTYPVAHMLWSVAATSNAERLFGVSVDGSLYMWNSGETAPARQIQGFLPGAIRMDFTEDGSALQLATSAKEVYEVNVQDASLRSIIPDPWILSGMGRDIPVDASLSPDGQTLAVLYFQLDAYGIRLFNLASGKLERKIPTSFWLEDLVYMPDGQSIIVHGRKHAIQILDINSGKVLKEIKINAGLGKNLVSMLMSKDRSTLALFGETGLVEIYNTSTLDLIQTLDTGPETGAISLSNDGSLLAYYMLNNTIGVWDLALNKQLTTQKLEMLPPDMDPPLLTFSPDNHNLALATWDGLVRIFELAP